MTTRTDTPTAWDERATLLTMLQHTRDTAAEKCRGLAPEHVGNAPFATSPMTSIGGLVNHMRWVERSWIETDFLGREDGGPWTEQEPDREFSIGATTPIETTLAEYAEQARRSDEVIAAHGLDERAVRPMDNGEHPTLRWILLHLIEENARHNGHIDILREMADGVTGD